MSPQANTTSAQWKQELDAILGYSSSDLDWADEMESLEDASSSGSEGADEVESVGDASGTPLDTVAGRSTPKLIVAIPLNRSPDPVFIGITMDGRRVNRLRFVDGKRGHRVWFGGKSEWFPFTTFTFVLSLFA